MRTHQFTVAHKKVSG